jgi:hypothetical protein
MYLMLSTFDWTESLGTGRYFGEASAPASGARAVPRPASAGED